MVRSAHTGGAVDLTSEGPLIPEVAMSVALLADSIEGGAGVLPPAFVCSRTNGALDAAWVQVARDLDLVTTLERTLGHSQSQGGWWCSTCASSRSWTAAARAIVNGGISARQLGRRLVLCAAPERRPHVDADRELRCGRDGRPRPGRAARPSAPVTRGSGSGSMSASAPLRAAAETVPSVHATSGRGSCGRWSLVCRLPRSRLGDGRRGAEACLWRPCSSLSG